MGKTLTIKEKNLQKLVNNFYEVCSLCDEMDIYEFDEGDKFMQKMKAWVDRKFGRNLETLKLKEDTKDQLLKLYENQIMDLTMMSKIELGDDVIEEIVKLKFIINE